MLPGGGEILIILVVILLMFGGKEMPKIMRTLGRWTSVVRSSYNDVRREFNRVSIEEELKQRDEQDRLDRAIEKKVEEKINRSKAIENPEEDA